MLQVDDVCDRPGLLDIDAALKIVLDEIQPSAGREVIALRACTGRITAATVGSAIPLPPFDQSAVDGYGIHAEDVGAGRVGPFRLIGRLGAGSRRAPSLNPGEVLRLLTGAAIPKSVAAVVMEEKVTRENQAVTLRQAVEAGNNIRRLGEDVGERSEIIESGTLIDARHIAMLAASGMSHIAVRPRVKVAVLSTGDELAGSSRRRRPNQIFDSNGPMLRALFTSPAVHLLALGACPDDPARLQRQIARAAHVFDLLICSGGVSGSDADHVVSSVRAVGGNCTKLSLALKPGKPLAIGHIGRMAVLALPGNPVAALVGALLFARPMLQLLSGQHADRHPPIMAKTASTFAHRLGRTEFLPVRVVGHDPDGTPFLETLGGGGSARLRPLVLADGLGCVPAETDDLPAGAALRYYPFRTAFGI